MLPLNLVLALLVALPPSLAALSGPGHRPPTGAHNLFAGSNGQAVGLGAGSSEDMALDEGLWATNGIAADELDLDEQLFEPVINATATREGPLKHGQPAVHKRAVIKNPKVIGNPKWTGRKPTSTTAAATKTTTTKGATSTAPLTLPGPPRSGCAPRYTNTAGGAIYGPGLGSFPMLPRPSTFVKRVGSGLVLDGNEYRIVGPSEPENYSARRRS